MSVVFEMTRFSSTQHFEHRMEIKTITNNNGKIKFWCFIYDQHENKNMNEFVLCLIFNYSILLIVLFVLKVKIKTK